MTVQISNFLELHYAIQLGLLFVLIITGAWRKSFTTVLFVISTIIMFFQYNCCMDTHTSFYIINALSVLAVLRAMLHDNRDTLIRKH